MKNFSGRKSILESVLEGRGGSGLLSAASLILFSGLVLNACSGDSGGSTAGAPTNTTSLSYSFNDNGCKTGSQTFSNHQDYCHSLLNDGLNNGCAYDERHSLHKRECADVAEHVDYHNGQQVSDSVSGQSGQTPAPNSGSTPLERGADHLPPAPNLAKNVTMTAHSKAALKTSEKAERSSVVVVLDGELIVDSIVADGEAGKSMPNLVSAKSIELMIESKSAGNCVFTTETLASDDLDHAINFAFVGADIPGSDAPRNCAIELQAMAQYGFTAVFKGVPRSGSDHSLLESVTLQVNVGANHPAEARAGGLAN